VELEEDVGCLVEVLSRHLHWRQVGVSAETRTQHLSTKCYELYRYTNPLGKGSVEL
jgi:hypothetical protein